MPFDVERLEEEDEDEDEEEEEDEREVAANTIPRLFSSLTEFRRELLNCLLRAVMPLTAPWD